MNYRYYINNTEVFPINAGDQGYDYARKRNVSFERKLKGEFVFNYTSSGFDFKAQESTDMSEQLEFRIEKKCNGAYIVVFEATFCVMEGDFDDDRCTFSIKLVLKEYTIPDLEVNILNAPFVTYGTTYGLFTGSGGGQRNYQQAHHFEDVLLLVAQESNPNIIGIKSDFFQINPDVISTDCLPGIPNTYTKLIFCALSNVQEPIPSNAARREVITFKQLMDDINILFDTDYFVDENNYLRVEHITWFKKPSNIDLTDVQYQKWVKAKHKYSYDLDSLPTTETLSVADSEYFAKAYFQQLGKVEKRENDRNLKTNKIRTDYRRIRYLGNSEASHGLFLFATEISSGAYRMLEDTNGENYTLTPYYLMKNIHTYDKPSLYAQFESLYLQSSYDDSSIYKSGGIIFNSTKEVKLQEEVSIPFCCENEFDPTEKVTSDMGDGVIQKASYDKKSSMLKMSLKYPVPDSFIFQPSDLDSLDLWLKYNEGITQSGGLISQWSDASGNARHAVQGTAANRPTYNGLTGNVEFSGNDFLTTPAFQLFPSKRGCIFILFEGLNNFGQLILSTNNTNPGDIFFDFSFNGNNFQDINNSGFPVVSYYPSLNTFVLDASNKSGLYVMNRISNTEVSCWHNGLLPLPVYNPHLIPNTQITSNPLVIGYNSVLNPYGGPIGQLTIREIIVYGRDLTSEERKKVEYYFVKKGIYNIYP